MANGISNFLTDKIFPAAAPDNQTANGNPKTAMFSPPATKGEANAALNHITGQVIARQPSASQTVIVKRADGETQKTVGDFLNEVLRQQPVAVNDQNADKVRLPMKVGKPSQETTREDYNLAFRRAVYNKAMDGLELTNEEIKQADKALIEAGLYQSYYNLQGSLDGLKANHQKSGNEMPITVGKQNIEYARRAGQAVLQYREYKAKQADAKQEGNQSKTNQMLLDPLRLGGNVPFRWTERLLNTPRDILQQIDKGEIMPGSATAKWIGGKIGEQITGQPAPQMPTLSESVENLTGAKLLSIPEIEVPRPFEYQTEKYKTDGKTGEDVGATAIDLFLLKRGIVGKPNATTPESLGNLNISKVFRVQGGIPPRASKFRIFIGESGEMVVKDKTKLFVTFDDMNRVKVFNGVNRAGKAEVISFQVKTSFVQQVRKVAVIQDEGKKFPELPQIADETKTNSSFGLPANWIEMLKDSTIRGTGRIEQLGTSTPFYKLFPAVTTTNQLKEQPK